MLGEEFLIWRLMKPKWRLVTESMDEVVTPGCAHEINFREINPHEINSYNINFSRSIPLILLLRGLVENGNGRSDGCISYA